MKAWLVSVLLTVLEDEKVQQMIRVLFDDAIEALQAGLNSRLDALEDKVLDRVASLPGELLGDATKDVGILLREITGTTDDIAGAVKGEVQPLLPTVDALESMFLNVLKGLPGGGILGGFLGR